MAETWVLNTRLDDTTAKTFSASFISAGNSYSLIEVKYVAYQTMLYYDSKVAYGNGSWTNEAYRTIVFDTAPTGNLLTWLQNNGTKQSDPEPTTPKNACLIDGTGYSIIGGKTLISGTAYSIENGKALISGVGYDISLSKKLSVDIQGTFTYTTVSIDGVSYTAAGVVKAKPDVRVTVTVSGSPAAITNSAIYYNGSKVATGKKSGATFTPATYSFTLKSDTTIQCTDYGGGRTGYAIATITT